MQCSGLLGVVAIVQKANFVSAGKRVIVHSKQAVSYGLIILAYPENPSVPPSINTF